MGRTRQETQTPVMYDAVRVDNQEVDQVDDPDAESAWDSWIYDLRKSASSGMIRVAKLPTDEKGHPLPNAKGQIQLGAWPHDQYDYDGLLAHVRQNFMRPGETCHIRITGFEAGKPGTKVNQIVSLQRNAVPSPVEAASSQLGEVLNAMREDRTATHQMLKELMTTRPEAPPIAPPVFGPAMTEIAKIALPIAGTIISALITRPAKPSSDIAGLVEIAKLLKDGGSSDDEKENNTTLDIIKAVAPQGLQLLNTLAQGQQRAALPVPHRSAAPTVAHVIGGAPASAAVRATSGESPRNDALVAPVPSTESQTISAASPTVSSENSAMFAAIKPHLEELCVLAERNENPKDVAELTVQMLPEGLQDQLAVLIEDKNKFAKLGTLVPAMKQHAEWFESLRAELENLLFDDTNSPA